LSPRVGQVADRASVLRRSVQEEAGKTAQSSTQRFQRLLRDLSREFSSLSAENARLIKESADLQELLHGGGVRQASRLKELQREPPEEEPDRRGAHCPAAHKLISAAGQGASSPYQPHKLYWLEQKPPPQPVGESEDLSPRDPPTVPASHETMAVVQQRHGSDALPSAEGSDESNDMLVDMRTSARSAAEFPREAICPAFLGQLRDQFSRLDTLERGALTAHDCWKVVSHFEHQMYGHVKHPFTRVVRTLLLVRSKYGDPAEAPEEDSSLDFGTFVRFMTDEHDMGNAEDTAYLKKAMNGEATDHMTAIARLNIAERRKDDDDPEPTGCLGFFLDVFPPVVILANALVLGFQAEWSQGELHWDIVETCFFVFYTTEILLKIRFLGVYKFFRGRDGTWNIFDTICLAMSLADVCLMIARRFVLSEKEFGSTDLVGMMKVFRLARLARIVRSFRYKIFDDLKAMVLGVLSGARVLLWSIVLFFICIYVLGVCMKELVGGSHEEFQSVPAAMFSVFRCFTDGCVAYNGTPLHERLRRSLNLGGVFMVLYILMFLVITVGVFNLIMAIFIDNVVSTTVKRKQQDLGSREEEMRIAIEEMLVDMLRNATSRRKGTRSSMHAKSVLHERSKTCALAMAQVRSERVLISRELFNTWLTDPDVLALFDEVEIDTATKSEIFDVCDVDKSGSLTPDELVSGLMRLRGPISKCDVIAIRLKVRYLTQMLEDIHHMIGA